jgi:hypothetical protein
MRWQPILRCAVWYYARLASVIWIPRGWMCRCFTAWCTYGGTVSGMRGHDIDIKAEMEIIRRILRQRPGVRDVVVDLIFR